MEAAMATAIGFTTPVKRTNSIKTLSPPVAPSLLHERQFFVMISQQKSRRSSSAKNITTTHTRLVDNH
jgi:hypothetical protein